jgi:hypothetical protein
MAYQSHHCSATLLCSACISVLLLLASSCAHLFIFSSRFYTLCCLFILFHCVSDLPFRSSTASLPTHIHHPKKMHTIFFVLHVFHTPSHLPDHHSNSLSSLAVIRIGSSSVVIILRFFGFSGSHNSSSSLAVTVSHFWRLWLLSPFLHVTIGSDQTPIQKVLHDLGLVSASSFFRYDLGR